MARSLCAYDNYFTLNKCAKSEVYYTMFERFHAFSSVDHRFITNPTQIHSIFVSKICPNGTEYHYQKCHTLMTQNTMGMNYFYEDLSNTDLCRAISCYTNSSITMGKKWLEIVHQDWVCDQVRKGTQLPMIHFCEYDLKTHCANVSLLRDTVTKCDHLCDSSDCSDEEFCNGVRYGIRCKRGNDSVYVPPTEICDGTPDCDYEDDEHGCLDTLTSTPSTAAHRRGVQYCVKATGILTIFSSCPSESNLIIPLFTYTRCAALKKLPIHCIYNETGMHVMTETPLFYPLCENSLDQTNCTDKTLVAITCPVDGFDTTVSKHVICSEGFYHNMNIGVTTLCDDYLDRECRLPSPLCRVHKHQLCDGIVDCADRSDEEAAECQEMSVETCSRRYKHESPLHVPIAWLNDGLVDCEDGSDEILEGPVILSPTCKVGTSLRFLPKGHFCENVFLCGIASTNFVKLENLCNGMNVCPAESRACKKSRPFKIVMSKALESKKVSGDVTKHFSYCIPGVYTSVGLHISFCVQEKFQFPESGVIGVTPVPIMIPEEKQNCKNFFGEQYVIMACQNRCKSTTCPLEVLQPNDCNMQLKSRTLSITKSLSKLTFAHSENQDIFSKIGATLKSDSFRCKNDRCVKYDKICNLVDDCGDHSDEENCTSVVHCEVSKGFIPSSEKCNGKVQCNDYRDECNDDCSKKIISGLGFKTFCWVIGFTAVVFNLTKILQNCHFLISDRQLNRKADTVLGLLINVGDFLTGAYLFSIVVVDTIVYGEEYCRQQFVWLSSDSCSFLGVISTVGTQLSLFSMTLLSLSRLFEILKFKMQVKKHFLLKMMILVVIVTSVSVVIAVVPLMSSYEDIFVNGMTYNPKIKLFLPYVDKNTHMDILQGFFGRIRMRVVKWKDINRLVNEMFTHDYENGTLNRRKIHFYGNDGVCLFKFFVNESDPQKLFVWSCLGVNLFCFLVISICYGIINFKYEDSNEDVDQLVDENQVDEEHQERKEFQRNIAVIIITDFICWVPFIFICILHSLELIDATPSYPVFSLVILPINSVINPLLYGEALSKKIRRVKRQVQHVFSRIIGRVAAVGDVEQIEMQVIQNRNVPKTNQPEDTNTPQFIIPRIEVSPPDNFCREDDGINC